MAPPSVHHWALLPISIGLISQLRSSRSSRRCWQWQVATGSRRSRLERASSILVSVSVCVDKLSALGMTANVQVQGSNVLDVLKKKMRATKEESEKSKEEAEELQRKLQVEVMRREEVTNY